MPSDTPTSHARRRRSGRVTTTHAVHRTHTNGHIPQAMTEQWKHRVEAEARFRLGKKLRGVKRGW